MRVPYMQEPGRPVHMPPLAGSAGGQYWLPQSQPWLVQLQLLRPPGEQAMPTTAQLERSGGTLAGQSLCDQQAQLLLPATQSHVRVPNVQLPRVGVQLPEASASVMGHI